MNINSQHCKNIAYNNGISVCGRKTDTLNMSKQRPKLNVIFLLTDEMLDNTMFMVII